MKMILTSSTLNGNTISEEIDISGDSLTDAIANKEHILNSLDAAFDRNVNGYLFGNTVFSIKNSVAFNLKIICKGTIY